MTKSNIRRFAVVLLLAIVGLQASFAQKDYSAYSSNYLAYPGPKQQTLTPAPAGYEPVYFSHYGRHGSRYHIGAAYGDTYKVLLKADSLGYLTDLGKDVLRRVEILYNESLKRDGELTELGAQQHGQIAERMYNRFPEIFSKPIHIDAKSTVVIRCILSMESALQQLKAMNPKLTFRHDASEHDMYFMNHGRDHKIDSVRHTARKTWDAFKKENVHADRLMKSLFTNDDYWHSRMSSSRLMENLFKLAADIQSCESRHQVQLWDIFTDKELSDWSDIYSTNWYVGYANSPLTKNMMPFSQRYLLRDIITKADSCLATGEVTAHLRYGHDTMVLPLSCLMELDDCNMSIADLYSLRNHGWVDSNIIPMAANIQLVFYKNLKNPKAPVLVKVLRNENEARLPLKTKQFPYYNWNDLRNYYLKKLDSFVE